MARQIHPTLYKSAAIGGSIIPGQGFLLGIAPAGWQNACGGASSFNSRPGWSGLSAAVVSRSLPSALEGQGGAFKGPKGSAIQRHRPQDGRCDPPCGYGTGTPSTNSQPDGPNTTGRMDDQAHGSRKPNHKTIQLVCQSASQPVAQSRGGDADADAEVSSGPLSIFSMCMCEVHVLIGAEPASGPASGPDLELKLELTHAMLSVSVAAVATCESCQFICQSSHCQSVQC